MTDKEELETILRLINKHGLPLSPILEYSINERLEHCNVNEDPIDRKESSFLKLYTNEKYTKLCEYEKMFENLNVSVLANTKAPNKAVLLLSIIQLVEDEKLIENRIFPGKEIAKEFSQQWVRYINEKKNPSVWIPYYRLRTEAFWHFMPNGGNELLKELNRDPDSMTIGKLRSLIQYAYLDAELFDYMRDPNSRNRLREVLIDTYIKNQ